MPEFDATEATALTNTELEGAAQAEHDYLRDKVRALEREFGRARSELREARHLLELERRARAIERDNNATIGDALFKVYEAVGPLATKPVSVVEAVKQLRADRDGTATVLEATRKCHDATIAELERLMRAKQPELRRGPQVLVDLQVDD